MGEEDFVFLHEEREDSCSQQPVSPGNAEPQLGFTFMAELGLGVPGAALGTGLIGAILRRLQGVDRKEGWPMSFRKAEDGRGEVSGKRNLRERTSSGGQAKMREMLVGKRWETGP